MDDIEKGLNAKSVLNNAAYKEAFIALKADIVNQWSRGTNFFTGRKEREKLHIKMVLLDELEVKLSQMITTSEKRVKAIAERDKLAKMRRR